MKTNSLIIKKLSYFTYDFIYMVKQYEDVKNFPLITFINFLKITHYLNLKIDQNGNMFLVEVMNI